MTHGHAIVLRIAVSNDCARVLTPGGLSLVGVESRTACGMIVPDNGLGGQSAETIAQEFSDDHTLPERDHRKSASGNEVAARHMPGDNNLLLNAAAVWLDVAVDRQVKYEHARHETQFQVKCVLFQVRRVLYSNAPMDPDTNWWQARPWSLARRVSGQAHSPQCGEYHG